MTLVPLLIVVWTWCPRVQVDSAARAAAPSDATGERATYVESLPGTTVTFEMVPVPAATSEAGDTVGGLWMAATETTWDAYDVLVFHLDEAQDTGDADAITRPTKPYIAVDRGFGHNGWPAISISFAGAEAYCEWLSTRTGRRYRLPTHTEWQYACRAGREDPLTVEELRESAWFRDNAERKTHAVGKKKANAWGLYDMRGNVAEWCTSDDGGVVAGGGFNDREHSVRADSWRASNLAWNASDPQIPKSPWWLADASFVGFRVVCDDPNVRGDER